MIDLVNCIQVTAERIEMRQVSRLGSRPNRDAGYIPWLKSLRDRINKEINKTGGLGTKLEIAKEALRRAEKECKQSRQARQAQSDEKVSPNIGLVR